MYKDVLVDINNIDSSLTTLQNDADDNDTHQQATSNNVTTDSDPASEFDERENGKKSRASAAFVQNTAVTELRKIEPKKLYFYSEFSK